MLQVLVLFLLLSVIISFTGSHLLMNAPLIQKLRFLFPSWRFFESVTPFPRVDFRRVYDSQAKTDWQPLPQKMHRRTWFQLFHNPNETFEIAYRTHLEHFINAVAKAPSGTENQLLRSSSFKIISGFIRQRLQDLNEGGSEGLIQIRIRLIEGHPFSSQVTETDGLILTLSEV